MQVRVDVVRRHELEHIIRAAAEITNRYEFVVIGSQSILGSVPNPPRECVMSMEADIFPMDAEELSDKIDGAIGEGSTFHEEFGYYAQGVDSTTATLPSGWRERLVRLQSVNTNGRAGLCLDPTDLFLAKCVANREKDRSFNKGAAAARNRRSGSGARACPTSPSARIPPPVAEYIDTPSASRSARGSCLSLVQAMTP